MQDSIVLWPSLFTLAIRYTLMRQILSLFLYLYFSQTLQAQQEELSVGEVYRVAIRQFIDSHPDMLYNHHDTVPVLFLKNHSHLTVVGDTLSGVRLVYVSPYEQEKAYEEYFTKRTKVQILDIQQMMQWDTVVQVWLLPMSVLYRPGKEMSKLPKYTGEACEVLYKYTPDRRHYIYDGKECRQL